MKTLCHVVAFCWLALPLARGASYSPTLFERAVVLELADRSGDHFDPPTTPARPPLPERLQTLVRTMGAAPANLQVILLKLAEAGVEAPPGPAGDAARKMAARALDGLAGVADAAALDKLTRFARSEHENLHYQAVEAAIATAARAAPDRLPALARALQENEDTDPVFIALDRVLALPEPGTVRVAAIEKILLEAIRNPKNERIFIDGVLEKNFPAYRRSPARLRLLNELKASPNEPSRAYAEQKLPEAAAATEKLGAAAVPAGGTATVAAATAPAEPAAGSASSATTDRAPGRIAAYAGLGGAAVLLGYWFWRRRSPPES